MAAILPAARVVNIGEAVGVIAAQSIGEPGTQLTMRTFHIGGAAQRGAEQSSVEAALDAKVKINNRNVVINSSGVPVVMGRNGELVLLDEAGREKARHRVPYGAQLLADDGVKVTRASKLAEWDPYTHPDHHREGRHRALRRPGRRRVDARGRRRGDRHLVEGRHRLEAAAARQRSAVRASSCMTRRARCMTLANGLEARYFLPVDAILSVENGAAVKAGDVLARIPREVVEDPRHHRRSAACRRAVRGAQAEGFRDHRRDRRPRRIRQGLQDQAPHRRGAADEGGEPVEYLIPKGKHISVQEGDYVEKGDLLIDGNPRAARHPAHAGRRGAGRTI